MNIFPIKTDEDHEPALLGVDRRCDSPENTSPADMTIIKSAPNIARTTVTLLLVALSAVAPSPLIANAGTPLLWATMFHLYLANILAAGIELGYLSKRFRRFSLPITFGIIMAGNAFSAILGFLLLAYIPAAGIGEFFWREDSPLQEMAAFALLIAWTWIISILAEYPFFRFALAGSYSHGSVLRADFLAHCFSYAALLAFYGLFAGIVMAS